MYEVNSTNAVLEAIFDTYCEMEKSEDEIYVPRITDNPVLNLMYYFLVNKYKERAYCRLKLDGDSRAFWVREFDDRDVSDLKKSEKKRLGRADVMLSFWTPFKRLVNEAKGDAQYKNPKTLEGIIDILDTNQPPRLTNRGRDIDTYEAVLEVAQFPEVQRLAELYLTRGNLWVLPSRAMNTARYDWTRDQVTQTLKLCFPGKALNGYFFDITPERWMERERLGVCFKGGNIRPDNLNTLEPDNTCIYNKWDSGEIRDYLRKVCDLIETRNDAFGVAPS